MKKIFISSVLFAFTPTVFAQNDSPEPLGKYISPDVDVWIAGQ